MNLSENSTISGNNLCISSVCWAELANVFARYEHDKVACACVLLLLEQAEVMPLTLLDQLQSDLQRDREVLEMASQADSQQLLGTWPDIC